MSTNKFTERLKVLRAKKNMSQTALANELGINQGQVISFYETGSRTPDLEMLIKIANYFNVSTDYLLGLSDYENSSELTNTEFVLNEFERIALGTRKKLDELSGQEKKILSDIISSIIDTLSNTNNKPFNKMYLEQLDFIVSNIRTLILNTGYIANNKLNFQNMEQEELEKYMPLLHYRSYKWKEVVIENFKVICDELENMMHNIWSIGIGSYSYTEKDMIFSIKDAVEKIIQGD